MSWRDRMLSASYRGARFVVMSDERQAGRRLQVHEYPKRDEPYTEDMGRAARRFGVSGYIIGPDYLSRLNALLAVLEASGAGTLVHPWFGTQRVLVDAGGTRVTHNDREGGMCRIDMLFVEAGRIHLPFAVANTATLLGLAVGKLTSALDSAFSLAFQVAGLPAFIATAAADFLALFGIGSDHGIDRGNPASITSTSVVTAVRSWAGTRTWPQALDDLDNLPAAPTAASTANLIIVRSNAVAIRELVAGELVGRLATLATARDWIAYEEALNERDAVSDRIEAVQLEAADTDTVYVALADVHTALVQHINAAATDASHLDSFTPVAAMPALAIAWRLYADADRDAEIIERNDIPHPGFCIGELHVLEQ